MHLLRTACAISTLVTPIALAGLTTPQDIVSAYSLTVSTTLPFPTATLSASDAGDFLISSWSLNKNKIQNQPDNLAFVSNPFPSSTSTPSTSNETGPVLQITYPSGSFGSNDGGVQFLSVFNGSIAPQTMLLSYEVAFDKGFQFVKGGKLPGLRGGSDTDGCEGGSEADGSDCWSARLMWRSAGEGEVYAYIPESNDLCSRSDIICNSDFGVSMDRGSFSFVDSDWNRVTLLVQLNSAGDLANGNTLLYYNDVQALQQTNLQLRSNTNVLAGGLFFSTFFGGNDPSWASPSDQHTFYRNFQMWASDRPSNMTGSEVSSATSLRRRYGYGVGWQGLLMVETVCILTVVLIYGMVAV